MYLYKIQFEKTFGVPWEFSNNNNIERYILFKERASIYSPTKNEMMNKSYESEHEKNDKVNELMSHSFIAKDNTEFTAV